MKIALVHELLTMRGGAEKVLKILSEMFPEAPIYTLLYDEAKLGDWFPRERVRTSIVQHIADRFPLSAHRYNHHLYLSRFPKAVEAWDFSAFDLVISSSSAFAHGIITNGRPKHLCYVHSPARYLWDRTHDVLERSGKGFLGPLKRAYLARTFHKLRIWDTEAADRPDMLLAASKEVQRRIELYWRRESEVVYPPIEDYWLTQNQELRSKNQEYFLIVSTLVPYKRIDIAIEACNQLKVPLRIIGEGPDRNRLEKPAGPTVTFLGYQSEEEVQRAYEEATATIFPGSEDFGLVPLESMACGTPVIAFKSGGALETVIEGQTGTFFELQTPENLAEKIKKFDHKNYSSEKCREQANKFSRLQFEQKIYSAVEAVMNLPS